MLNTDLLSGVAKAAEFTGLTKRQVSHLVEKGKLPVIRKGRALFFRKSELERAFSSEATNV